MVDNSKISTEMPPYKYIIKTPKNTCCRGFFIFMAYNNITTKIMATSVVVTLKIYHCRNYLLMQGISSVMYTNSEQ